MKGRVRSVGLWALAALAVVTALGAEARRATTPEATSFGIRVDDPEQLVTGIVETVPGSGEGVGFAIRCVRRTGALEGTMAFGGFPEGKPVQAAVRLPSGRVERFGPVLVGRRGAGFHAPQIAGRAEVVRLMNAAMVEGALISNGHNSVWNRVSRAENERARRALSNCRRP